MARFAGLSGANDRSRVKTLRQSKLWLALGVVHFRPRAGF